MRELKKYMSYNVHQRTPQIHARTKEQKLWLVKMTVRNELGEHTTVEMRNILPVFLPAMLPLIMEQLTECIGELSPISQGMFVIYERGKDV